MSPGFEPIAWLVGGVILVFWTVGAYNRLLALRNDIGRAFALVDVQWQARQSLLLQWVGRQQASMAEATLWHGKVIAACGVLQAASDQLRARPSVEAMATAMREAEASLALARRESDAAWSDQQERPAAADDESVLQALSTADQALAFAREQFNRAAGMYNEAIRQFPTLLVARVFSFKPAGTL
jgi:LemA protein